MNRRSSMERKLRIKSIVFFFLVILFTICIPVCAATIEVQDIEEGDFIWSTLDVDTTGLVSVHAWTEGNNNDIYLYLYNETGVLVAKDLTSYDANIDYIASTTGTYTVKTHLHDSYYGNVCNLSVSSNRIVSLMPKYNGSAFIDEGDAVWYDLIVEEGQLIFLHSWTEDNNDDIYLYLYNETGVLVASDLNTVYDANIDYIALTSGTYTVKTHLHDSYYGNPLNLSVSSNRPLYLLSKYERSASMPDIEEGDFIWSTLDVDTTGLVSVHAWTEGNNNDIYLYLYNETGVLVAKDLTSYDANIDYIASTTGTYTVKTHLHDSYYGNVCNLSVSSNRIVSLMPKYNGSAFIDEGDAVWYDLIVEEGQLIFLHSWTEDNNDDIYLYLYNETGVLVASDLNTVYDANIDYIALTAGTYTVKTHLYYAYSGSSRNLSVSSNCPFADTFTTITIDAVTSPTNLEDQTVTGTMESGVTVEVTCPTAMVGIVTTTDTTWSVEITGMTEGNNVITAIATDQVGNTASDTATIVLDTIPPTITIDSPVNNSIVNSPNITVLGNVTDDFGIKCSFFEHESQGVGSGGGGCGVPPYPTNITINRTVTLHEGWNRLSFGYIDVAGNLGNASIVLTLDTNPPIITIDPVISPTNLDYQTVTGTMESGAIVEVTCPTSTVGTVTTTDTTWSVEITDLSEGVNAVNVVATDNAGNQNTTTITIYLESTTAESILIRSATTPPNSTITIPVSLINVTNITGISFDLLYNSSVVTVSSVSASVNFTGSSITPNIDNANGNTKVVLTNSNLISASAETPVIDIAFNVIGGFGSFTSLDLQNVEFSDNEFNPYTPVVVVDGVITVGIKGDFNGNGRVDIGDVAKVAFMVAGKVPEDLNADFNENGRVDIGDAAKIAFYLAGKVGEL